jgi:hypothetical protein
LDVAVQAQAGVVPAVRRRDPAVAVPPGNPDDHLYLQQIRRCVSQAPIPVINVTQGLRGQLPAVIASSGQQCGNRQRGRRTPSAEVAVHRGRLVAFAVWSV